MIKYDTKTLESIKRLSNINPIVSLEIIEDYLVLFSNDTTGDISFTYKTPKEGFDFEREKIHFLSYPDFYSSFKALSTKTENPKLEIKEEDDQLFLEMSLGTSTMGVALDSGELIIDTDAGVKDVGDLEVLATIAWSAERDKRFKSMINAMTKSPTEGLVEFTCDGTNIVITILNDRQNNSFKETISYDEDTLKSFSYRFHKNIFSIIPDGDYLMTIYDGGILELDIIYKEPDPSKLTFQTSKC
jgi:hypothetical protein